MVSDTSLDELHVFARELGIPPRGFHGDHYDLPQHVRDEAVRRGAVPTTSSRVAAYCIATTCLQAHTSVTPRVCTIGE